MHAPFNVRRLKVVALAVTVLAASLVLKPATPADATPVTCTPDSTQCPPYGEPTVTATGPLGPPRRLASGDLNGDKRPDLVIVTQDSSYLSVVLSTSTRTLAPPTTIAATSSGKPQQVALADMNGDRLTDLVVSAHGWIDRDHAYEGVVVLFNSPENPGSFPTRAILRTDRPSGAIAAADLTNDGRPDIAVGNDTADSSGQYTMQVLVNNGDSPGTFRTPVTTAVPHIPYDIAIVGMRNLDTRYSYAAVGGPGYVMQRRFTIDATGSLSPKIYDERLTASHGQCAQLGEFNGDQTVDLAVCGGRGVYVHTGTSTGFAASPSGHYATDLSVRDAMTGDVNRDGVHDLVAVSAGDHPKVVVLVNPPASKGSLLEYRYAASYRASSVVVANLNADNDPDIAVGHDTTHRRDIDVMYFLGITGLSPTAEAARHTVYVEGTGLRGATATFGSLSATVNPESDRKLAVTVPDGAPSGRIAISRGGVTRYTQYFTYIPRPTLSGASPEAAIHGSTVKLTGTGLKWTTGVTFQNARGAVPAEYTVVSDTELSVKVPLGATGWYITATSRAGNATLRFVVLPRFYTPSTSNGRTGSVVQLYGSGFTNVGSVEFTAAPGWSSTGWVEADFELREDGIMSATVPPGAQSGPVRLTKHWSPKKWSATTPWNFVVNSAVGRSVLAAGATTMKVSDVDLTPTSAVLVTPHGNVGSVWAALDVANRAFTITVSNAPAANVEISWMVA